MLYHDRRALKPIYSRASFDPVSCVDRAIEPPKPGTALVLASTPRPMTLQDILKEWSAFAQRLTEVFKPITGLVRRLGHLNPYR